MARDASVAKAGYFPLDPAGFDDVAAVLRVGTSRYGNQGHVTMLDPCAGQGESMRLARAIGRRHLDACDAAGTSAPSVAVDVRWCELEESRAGACVMAWERAEREQKAAWSLAGGARGGGGSLRREVACELARGDAFCLPAVGGFQGDASGTSPWVTLLYLNPPYDADPTYGRLEEKWLDRFTQHVVDGGVLAFVVPLAALRASAATLSRRWTDVQVGRVREGSASAAFAATQVVVLARRLSPDLAAPDLAASARLLALVSRGVDALPGVADLRPVDVPDTARAPVPGWAWRCDAVDVASAAREHVPWHRSVRRSPAGSRRRSPVVPVREALPADRTWAELSSRTYPTLMSLKPSYVADAIASGALDGELVTSVDGLTPDVLVKGMFDRRFREVEIKYDSQGEARTSVQVQRPSLRVSVLDPARGEVHVLGDSALPTGSTELSGFTVGDLVSRYGPSLAAALGRRCPVIAHDGDGVVVRPLRVRRPLYAAQAAAVDASARRLLSIADLRAAGRTSATPAVLLQGQPGTGKTSMSLAVARAVGARRVLVVCPPHLVAEEAAWLSDASSVLGSGPVAGDPATGPGCSTYVLSSVLDLAAYEAACAAADAAGDERTQIAVCSREVAKLGHGYDGVAGSRCPACGAVDPREPAKLASTRARCRAPVLRAAGPRRLRDAAEMLTASLAWCSSSPVVTERLAAGTAVARWRVRSGLVDAALPSDVADRRFVRASARAGAGLVLAHVARVERASTKPGGAPLSKAQAEAIDTLRGLAGATSKAPTASSAEHLLLVLRNFVPLGRAGRVVRVKGADGPPVPGPECGEPLYQATPRPRRWPLVRALVDAARRGAFDLLVLDEAHEYGNYDSAQAQAAERLVATGVPVVFATGTACNGYMSSMHAFFRVLSPDYARDFARDDRPAAVARFGYQRRQVDLSASGAGAAKREADTLELGAVSDRVVKGGVKVTGQAPGILPEALLRYLAPATAQVHLDDLGVDLPPISDARVDVEPTEAQAKGLRYLAEKLMRQTRADRTDPEKAGKLFGQFAGLPSFLDRCSLPHVVGVPKAPGPGWVVSYPAPTPAAAKRGERGEEVARVAASELPRNDEVLPKEAALAAWVVAQLRRGRPCLVYVWHWDLLPRVADAVRSALATADLSPPGRVLGAGTWCPGDVDAAGDDPRVSPTTVNVSVLDPGKVPPVKREAWIGKAHAARNAVLVTNPAAVKTGINSLARWWCSAAWFEGPGCSPEIRRQATHRLHRIGQRRPVEVASFVYAGTMQAALHELLLSKVGVSEAVDGLDATAALAAAGVGEADAGASLEVGRALYRWCERAARS